MNDDFYRERAQRTRSRINHASWVAYIFGLGALLVFRPVGLVSIAAGLLLSIAYYAIPVEPPASKKNPRPRLPFWQRVKQQVKMERVSIPIPNFPKRKLVFVGTPLIAAIVGYSANVILLQQPVDDVLRSNPAAFAGMNVSAHYEYYMVPGVVVYDLRTIGIRQTPIDVHTAFLEFAKKVRDNRYKRVELSYRGHDQVLDRRRVVPQDRRRVRETELRLRPLHRSAPLPPRRHLGREADRLRPRRPAPVPSPVVRQ